MPHALVDREIDHSVLTELILANNIHDRKAMSAEHADAHVVLPDAGGTMEGFLEQWTWAQIGYLQKSARAAQSEWILRTGIDDAR